MKILTKIINIIHTNMYLINHRLNYSNDKIYRINCKFKKLLNS